LIGECRWGVCVWLAQMVFSGAGCAHTVGNLKPATRYRFRVRSNGGTGHGFGEHSAAVSVSTPVDPHAAEEATAEVRLPRKMPSV
jgi:hypothetical protein